MLRPHRATLTTLTPIKTRDTDMEDSLVSNRPARKNAGKRSIDPNYVNSTDAIRDALGDLREERKEVLSSGKKKNKRKRERTPSPQPQPLSPVECPTQSHFDTADVISTDLQVFDASQMEPLSLTFNIPPNFEGPLRIVLDPTMFTRQAAATSLRLGMAYPLNPPKRARREEATKAKNKRLAKFIKAHGQPRGFCHLPPELRNNIYRTVFVTKEPIEFPQPVNAARGGAFLRTCRLVHQEACGILYSENRFTFRRTKLSRVPFWAPEEKEVGYLDMRHFLVMIGPDNRGFLRRIHLILEDALRLHAPQLPDEGRFIHDGNLMACLKIVAKECYLKKLCISFYGRRNVCKFDVRFVEALCRIQIDELVLNPGGQWGGAKYSANILELLKTEMVRDEPMYETEKLDKNKRFTPGNVAWA